MTNAEDRPTIGLVHPGAMGSSLGAQLVASGTRVVWAGAGRSDETTSRAESAGLVDVDSLEALVDEADVVLSVCPPASAVEVAASIASLAYDGTYIDANAVSPATARTIASNFDPAVFVDGGIVGPPVNGPGTTRLYLSGADETVASVAALFVETDLEVRAVDGEAGAASAVKMCFAAWTKGTTALLFNICALAEAEGVTESIQGEWATSMPELLGRAERSPAGVGPKAWRFEGEMREIASSFDEHDLPDGFHVAAADVYARLASLKGSTDTALADVIHLLSASS